MKFATKDEVPLVSVCIITYNHEKYIAAAIESVLMQMTDFPCDLIIAEDCSKDATRKILLEYAEKYPIKLILQPVNVGAARNWKTLMDAPTGKYVAYFEGDDSWTDPEKLQKQFNILEKNPEAALCYSNALIHDTQNPGSNICFTDDSKPSVFKDCYESLKYCPMPTCTIFFRNLLKPFPEWTFGLHAGDYILVALICKYGGIYYLDAITALHNHHYQGLSRTIPLENYYYNDAPLLHHLNRHYDFDPRVFETIIGRNIGSVDLLFHMAQFNKAIILFWKLPFFKAFFRLKSYRMAIVKLFIKIHFLFFLSKRQTYRVPNAPQKISST